MTCVVPAGFRSLPLSVTQLSLSAVLQCGQSFRWSIFPLVIPSTSPGTTLHSPTHEYRLCLRDRIVCLRQCPDILFYRSVFPNTSGELDLEVLAQREKETLAWIHDYFQLNVDLVSLYNQWGKRDPVFQKCKERFSGIRMLRQDPFENIISFICSSNNNIVRITKMVKALCQRYSPALATIPPPDMAQNTSDEATLRNLPLTETYHPFPPPSALARPEVTATLRSLGFGYRADYIQKTCKMLVDARGSGNIQGNQVEPAESWLQTLRNLSTLEARDELLKFVGVGRKVADCVLLMSLDKHEVIPVDTHVHQIAVKHYGMSGSSKSKMAMTPKLYDEVSNKLAAVWGDHAGWAHSVLFTSDLKSFASYGLPSPSPSPSIRTETLQRARKTKQMDTMMPPSTPTIGKRKRGRPVSSSIKVELSSAAEQSCDIMVQTRSPLALHDDFGEHTSMVDRVKQRRRRVI